MKRTELNRRDFNRLTSATFGGLLAGTIAGCGGGEETAAAENPLLSEPHVCRGLNTCQGKGKSGDNQCAGEGSCFTVSEHSCHGENDCKGQGGCGETVGQNACDTKGECAVKLGDTAWEKAHTKFTELMEAAGKTVGEPPA